MSFPPMPGPPEVPIIPHVLRGVLTDRDGNNILTGAPVIVVNETHSGNDRKLSRSGGEILIDMGNVPDWAVGDDIRVQVTDYNGNGEVYYVIPLTATGNTSITKVIRPINPVCGKRPDKFTGRSIVRT